MDLISYDPDVLLLDDVTFEDDSFGNNAEVVPVKDKEGEVLVHLSTSAG